MNPHHESTELRRNLRNRHIQLIAFGGTIGTGLFMGSGNAISQAGPSIIFCYLFVGILLFFVLRALGELLLSNLGYKSFVDIAHTQLGKTAGYFVGWTYWMCWIVTGIAEVIGITAYIHFWWPYFPSWSIATITVIVLLGLNLVSVRAFGELEFWFSLIKIFAIIALIVCGVIMVTMRFHDIQGNVASVSNLWSHGGLFPHGMFGLMAGLQLCVFAFVGVELVGAASAETHDPHRTLPKAVNAIPIRILLFYVLSLLVIVMVTPWNLVEPTQSPFVQLFSKFGLVIAASAINFVVLVAAASSANSGLYSTSRMLYGLALGDSAHKQFGKLSKKGVPAIALVFSSLCLFIGAILLYIDPDIIQIFTIVTTCSAILFMFVWSMILISYLVYRKKQPHLHRESKFKLPGGQPICWLVLIAFVFLLTLLYFSKDTRLALYAAPVWFILLAITYPLTKKKKISEAN